MIITTLKECEKVASLHPLFPKLFDFFRTHDLLKEELGVIELDGQNLFVRNMTPTCIKQEEQKMEIHRDYIDVHILLEGCERIGWKATEDLEKEVSAYDEKDDYALYADQPTMYVDLLPYQIAITFPEDAHAPIIGEGQIRKMVAKVKMKDKL